MNLRTKLAATWVGAGLLLVVITIWAASTVTERTVLAQVRERIDCSRILLNAALASVLAQKDYATLQQILDETRHHAGISFLVVNDVAGRRVAASGSWHEADLARTRSDMPKRDADGESRFHVQFKLEYAGQQWGVLHYAQSAATLDEARASLYRTAGEIGFAALILGALLLSGVALAVTRPLTRLMDASARVSLGDYHVALPV